MYDFVFLKISRSEDNFMLDRKEIKLQSKSILRAARVNPLLMTAILLVIQYVLNKVVTFVQYGSFSNWAMDYRLLQAMAAGDLDAYSALLDSIPRLTPSGTFLSVLVSLAMLLLSAGYSIYCMGIRQGLEMPYSTLLDGLGAAGKLIWCSILMYVKVALWSMLFFFPGVVAAYRYRFAIYNLLTDSSLTASQAIRLSCEQTRGVKGQLFVLDLSFLGWTILSSLTLGILNIWLTPYVTLCDLAYFEDSQQRLGRSPYGGGQDAVPPPTWDL